MKIQKSCCLLAALMMLAAALSGCGNLQSRILDPDHPVQIMVWHYYNGVQQENFDRMVREFNETVGHEQGVVVETRGMGTVNELADSALASLRGDIGAADAPDMFTAYAETAFVADQLGYAVDLSQFFSEDELAAYIEGYLEEGDLNNSGELKIFPTAKSTEVMMLNLTDWQTFADETGVSFDDLATWEGLAETAEIYYQYTDALTPDIPNDGKAFFGRDAVANYMIVGAKQLGMEFFTTENDSLTVHTDTEILKQLWECYYVPYVKGYYFSQSRYRSDDAKIGAIVAMVCSTTGAAYFPTSVTIEDSYTYPIEACSLPVPNFADTEPYVVQQGAGMVVVKSDAQKEYACSVFLKWITEKEQNISFSVSSGYLPVKKDANAFDSISEAYLNAEHSENSILLDALEAAVAEINSCQLYTAKPFAKSAEARAFLESYIQDTAQTAHDAAAARIKDGEDRETVLQEYVSDDAYAAWYEAFCTGLAAAANE